MTTNTQHLRESAEKAKAFADHLTPTHPETAKAHINGLADLVCICCDELDALRAENERLREALQWYQGKSKAMASAAISGDRQAMLKLMQEIAVDYGKRASAALSGEGK